MYIEIMRMQAVRFLFVSIMAMCGVVLNAQITVTGIVVDAENVEPLIGAAVMQGGTSHGVVTDANGVFSIDVSSGNGTLIIKSLGYNDVSKPYSGSGKIDLGTIKMTVNTIALADVIISSSMAIARKTPVALSVIEPQFISERIGMRDFPELLRTTPSIYVAKGGGGFGDTEIMMRGFKRENIAVMVNGVPMNDMENGTVYWSNWSSLADVTRNQQVQRGLGASKVSAPSVGGSINIVTSAADIRKGGFISYKVGEDGYNKLLFSASTGLSDKGWAMTLMGGKEWGDGYIQGTEYESYTYFLSIAKRINDKHQLSLTGFGSPQWHNQRNPYDGLTVKGWQSVKGYMESGRQYRYNPTYGFDKNGQRRAANKNKYHKPQVSLNHMWQINNSSSLSTALYVSMGEGWGTRGEGNNGYSGNDWFGSNNGELSTKFRKADGTFAYDEIQELNENSDTGSKMVMTVSKNGHKWYGLLSSYTRELNENINIYAGIDGRYYIGEHTNEIQDLYGGSYYVDPYRNAIKAANNSAATSSFKVKKLTVGDIVRRDFDGHVLQGGVFGQGEYSTEQLSAFVSASVSHTTQWRYDRFYYDKNKAESEKVGKLGFTAKGGANFNFNDYHNVFANAGIISRAPYLDGGIFLSVMNSNLVNPDAVNEKVYSFELGYGFQNSWMKADLNAYHTMWNDKTMTNYMDITTANNTTDRAVINMQGVNAIHQGIEFEAMVKPFAWLDVRTMFSIGNWRWSSNPSGYWYNSSGQPLKNSQGELASGVGAGDHVKSTLNLDGAKVGNSAQTTAFAGIDIKPAAGMRMSLDWNFAGRIYADYGLSGSSLAMNNAIDFETPWRIPSAHTFDFSASYSFKIGSLDSTLSGMITNLFDQEYIQSARDGSDHTWKTADRVYYGFGRQMSMGLKVNF